MDIVGLNKLLDFNSYNLIASMPIMIYDVAKHSNISPQFKHCKNVKVEIGLPQMSMVFNNSKSHIYMPLSFCGGEVMSTCNDIVINKA